MNKAVYCNNVYTSEIREKTSLIGKWVKQIMVHPYKDHAERIKRAALIFKC